MASRGGSSRGQQPSSDNPIACRLCGEVFMTIQALIKHIEVHVPVDHIARRHYPFNFIKTPPPPPQPFPIVNPSTPYLAWPPPPPPTPIRAPMQISGLNNSHLLQLPNNPRVVGCANPHQVSAPRPQHQPRWPPPPSRQQKPGTSFEEFCYKLLGHSMWDLYGGGPDGRRRPVEEPPNDGTMPLLKQLEKNIPMVIDLVDDEDSGDEADEEMLDLTLKL